MKNENLTPAAEQEGQEQQTRVMQPVEPTARPPRRRRSDRYADETPAAEAPKAEEKPAEAPPQTAEESTAEAPDAEEASPREPAAPIALQPRTRVVTAQESSSRPPVPRPNLLRRAEQASAQNAQDEDGLAATTRRPMGTPPGFVPRQPIALEGSERGRGAQTSGRVGVTIPPRTAPAAPASNAASASARRPASLNREQPAETQKKNLGRKVLIAAVALLLVVGLVLVGVLLLGQRGGEDKDQPVTVMASGFTAAIDRGTAPLDVVFNLTTDKSVSQVRLVNEDGVPLNATSVAVTENADNIIWMMNLSVTDGFEGLVLAQVYDGETWQDTGMSQSLEIAMPAPAATIDVAAFNETTDAPTDVPTEIPTEEPTDETEEEITDAPTPEPTAEPTATPTLAVSATPTVATAGTPTPIPAELAVTQAPITDEALTEVPEAATPELITEPSALPEAEETAPAAPTATPPLTGVAAAGADPALIRDSVIYKGSSKTDAYHRERMLNMPIADGYLTQPYGVLTYRGDAFRQNAAVGAVSDLSGMTVAWAVEAGSVKGSSSTYYGIGWTGQPAIIKWSKEIRAATNIAEEKRETSALKEVIVAGMDGKIYFLDLADGEPTRNAINLGYPMRGTPSLHPLGYPIMTVGQYGRKMASGTGDIGLRFYNLLTQKQAYWIDGLDGKANRPYNGVGAFDTSALIDRNTDTLVAIGTNGMLYTVDLNTEYSMVDQKVSITPSVVSMKSRTKGQADKYTAVQSSPAMYGSYVYYADMQGVLRCVDTTSMTTVWAVETGDAVEAAIALDMDENGDLWLYTANTLDNRGFTRADVTIRRYDALTGEEDWALPVYSIKAKNGKTPGAMASPVIGQNELGDLVYFTLSNVAAAGAEALFGGDSDTPGLLLALDKTTGEVVWTHQLDAYSYSSPVAVYGEDGHGWIIQASSSGLITLLDGLTGTVVSTLEVEGTIDASPAVYNDTLVIGTTGKNTSFIYGIKLH